MRNIFIRPVKHVPRLTGIVELIVFYLMLTGFVFAEPVVEATDADNGTGRISSGHDSISLSKLVCNASITVCDLLSGQGFTETTTGEPQHELIYRLQFSSSANSFYNINIADRIPAFTTLKPSSIAVVSEPPGMDCVMFKPSAQAQLQFTSTLIWDCVGEINASETGVVVFSVTID